MSTCISRAGEFGEHEIGLKPGDDGYGERHAGRTCRRCYAIEESATCTDPHVATCPRCPNSEPPIYLVRVPEGCDAAYVCTDCKHAWETAWGCAE